MSWRYPFGRLLELSDLHTLGVSGESRHRLEREGLTIDQAERYAQRAGLHPCEVWPELVDDLAPARPDTTFTVTLTCVDCGRPARVAAVDPPHRGGTRATAALVCPAGHRQTLTVTLSKEP